MIDEPRILYTEAQHTAVIRLTIPKAGMQASMGPAIQEVMETLAEQDIAPTGPVFAHHFRMDSDLFDFEVGVPVAGLVEAAGRVVPGRLLQPPGRLPLANTVVWSLTTRPVIVLVSFAPMSVVPLVGKN